MMIECESSPKLLAYNCHPYVGLHNTSRHKKTGMVTLGLWINKRQTEKLCTGWEPYCRFGVPVVSPALARSTQCRINRSLTVYLCETLEFISTIHISANYRSFAATRSHSLSGLQATLCLGQGQVAKFKDIEREWNYHFHDLYLITHHYSKRSQHAEVEVKVQRSRVL